jgi:hypothetical protein
MRKHMMGLVAAGLATASLVAVSSSAEARWGGRGWSGARVAGWGGGYGGWRGYHRGWNGGGFATGAVLGAVTGAALASSYGYGYGGYGDYYGYAPVSYGYAPYAYPASTVAYYEDDYPTTVAYTVPAYRRVAYYPRRIHRVAYYPRRAYRTVNVIGPRRAYYRTAYRSGFRAAAYGGPARGHFVRSNVVRHRWH